MSASSADTAPGRHRESGWDVRVVFVERRKQWWWNAWMAATSTELYGFADSPIDAWSAMNAAITATQLPDQLAKRRAASAASAASAQRSG